MIQRLKSVTVRVLFASFLLLLASPAFGQFNDQEVTPAPEPETWKAMTLGIFFAFAIAIACAMTPKRTHQD